MKEKEIEVVKQRIVNLYNNISKEENEKITNIKFCEEMIIVPQKQDNIALAEDIYVVEKEVQITKDIKEKRVELYIEEGQRVAIISEDGSVMFDEAYIDILKQRYKNLFKMIKIEEAKVSVEDISKENEEKERVEMKEEELEEKQKEQSSQQNQAGENNYEEIQKIAKVTGIRKEEMKACTEFDPNEKITSTENFYDILPNIKQYEKIYIVASNKNTKGNSLFHFVGITKDGMAEQIEDLEPTEGINTSKEVISINRDGTEIKEKQVSALFKVGNDNKGFSVSIGNYGVIEAEYVRRSNDNKYISSNINTRTQKITTREVEEFMSDTRNPYIEDNVDKAEKQINEKENEKTNIENIDDNEYNDIIQDVDEEIELDNGKTTTIRREAEKAELSIEEYVRRCEEERADTIQEKIEKVNEQREEEKKQELAKEFEEEEGERTPWGDAYRRMSRNH